MFKIESIQEAKDELDLSFHNVEYTILHEWNTEYEFYLVCLYNDYLYFVTVKNLFCDTWEAIENKRIGL